MPDVLKGADFPMAATVAAVVSDAEHAIARLNAPAAPALAPLARLLLRTESIASSRIEGLQVGVRQLARAEARMGTGGRVSPTVREVLGNIDAMHRAIDIAATAPRVEIDHIVEIHAELMSRAPNAHVAGKIRTEQNWIGGNDHNPCGADFVPPPPEAVRDGLMDLCEAIVGDEHSPLVQAALVHAQFETIHPFVDGNGRTGRALIHVVLRRRGLATAYIPPISVIFAGDRERYVEGLVAFRRNEVESWIEQFAVATARAVSLAQDYLEAVTDLMEHWREQLRSGAAPRSDAAAWALLDVLPAHPVVTTPAATAATGRAKSAVHKAIAQLVQCGVLDPLSSSRRNRSWEAVGLLDLIEGLDAGA